MEIILGIMGLVVLALGVWLYKAETQIEKLQGLIQKLEFDFAKLERETQYDLPKKGIYVNRLIGSYTNQEYLGTFEEVFMAIVKHLNITRTPDLPGSIQFKSKDE